MVERARDELQQAQAQNLLGVALFSGGDASPKRLLSAEMAFRQSLELLPQRNLASYNLGRVLLKLERDEEGVAVLEQLLEEWPDVPVAEESRRLIENPLRARKPIIPPFELVTLDGELVDDEGLAGKVVLFDFWATWCKPCLDAIPHLKRLSLKSEKAPFEVLSVSIDDSETTLREFVEREAMTWKQVWDRDRSFSAGTLKIDAYPTYVVIDHEGVVQLRLSGWSSAIESRIDATVAKAIRAAARARR